MQRKIRLMVVLELTVASKDGFHEPTSGQAIEELEQALHGGAIDHSVETARELHYGEQPLIEDIDGFVWQLGRAP